MIPEEYNGLPGSELFNHRLQCLVFQRRDDADSLPEPVFVQTRGNGNDNGRYNASGNAQEKIGHFSIRYALLFLLFLLPSGRRLLSRKFVPPSFTSQQPGSCKLILRSRRILLYRQRQQSEEELSECNLSATRATAVMLCKLCKANRNLWCSRYVSGVL